MMDLLNALFGSSAQSDLQTMINFRSMDAMQHAGTIQYLEQRIDALSARIADLEKKLADTTARY